MEALAGAFKRGSGRRVTVDEYEGRRGKRTWEGNLRVPTLGGNPIELTGPAFRAHFVKERPSDE